MGWVGKTVRKAAYSSNRRSHGGGSEGEGEGAGGGAGDSKGVGEGEYAGVTGAKHLAQGRNALPAVTRRNAKWHEKIEAMGKNAQASCNRVRPLREAPFCTFRAFTA